MRLRKNLEMPSKWISTIELISSEVTNLVFIIIL